MSALGNKLHEEQPWLNPNTQMLPSTGLLKGNLGGNYRRKFKVHDSLNFFQLTLKIFPQLRTDTPLLTYQVRDILRLRASTSFHIWCTAIQGNIFKVNSEITWRKLKKILMDRVHFRQDNQIVITVEVSGSSTLKLSRACRLNINGVGQASVVYGQASDFPKNLKHMPGFNLISIYQKFWRRG